MTLLKPIRTNCGALQFGRFFYRFPNGESGADTYDRITNFQDHMIRDIDAGRFPANAQLVGTAEVQAGASKLDPGLKAPCFQSLIVKRT